MSTNPRRTIIDPLALPAEPEPGVPPPQRVSHLPALWWWLGLAGAAGALLLVLNLPHPRAPRAPSAAARTETAHFHAFSFGDVREDDARALAPEALRAQLEQLKDSGAHTVRLAGVEAFLKRGLPLPARPVLLVFEEAGRETIEAVDPIIAELGMNATALVSVPEVERGNIALTSKRRLTTMAQSGRWDLGVRVCPAKAAAPVEDYRAQVAALTEWTGAAPAAIGCPSGAPPPGAPRWLTALEQSGLSLGFLGRVGGANLRSDSPAGLRLIRIDPDDHQPDALVRRVQAHQPRHEPFTDDFSEDLSTEWVAEPAHARLERGWLHLRAEAGSTAGSLTLGGTERWRDVGVVVDVRAPTRGQFWIYARYQGPDSFVRLGLIAQRVVLQKATPGTATRQLADATVKPGPVRLTLRLIGSRALAWIDGEPLTQRPAELPDELVEGPVILGVWDTDAAAEADLDRVELTPLPRTVALLPSSPGEETFEQLRARAADLWGISPRLFTWRRGKGSAVAETDASLDMFASYHRLAVLPAVTLAQWPHGDELRAFHEQLLRWADGPRVAGLNLVVERLDPEQSADVELLRRELAEIGKELTITLPERATDVVSWRLAWLVAEQDGSATFQVERPEARWRGT